MKLKRGAVTSGTGFSPRSLPPQQPAQLVIHQFPPCNLARRQVQLDRTILGQREQLPPSSNRLVVLLAQLRRKFAGIDRGQARSSLRCELR
jgi:hypothetical protein